jgi:hypothetical protein
MRAAPLATLLALTASCGTTPSAPTDAAPADVADAADASNACTPSREVFNTTVRPLLTQHCGSCHGATPSFGAPYTLLDYDSLLRGVVTVRPIDRIGPRLVDGTMPPAGAPAVPDDAKRALAEWASCGALRP